MSGGRLWSVVVTVAAAGCSPPGSGPTAFPGADRYALVGEEVVLDGSASVGAVRFQWAFGDGPVTSAGADAIARTAYGAPGRYAATLTVWDATGKKDTGGVVISVTHPPGFRASMSSTLAWAAAAEVAAVVPDAKSVVVAALGADGSLTRVRSVPLSCEPRQIVAWGSDLAVTCPSAGVLEVIPSDGSAPVRLSLGEGSRPFGAAALGDALYVALAGPGALAEVRRSAGQLQLASVLGGFADARGVSALPDGRVAVTRWRAADDGNEVWFVDVTARSRERVALPIERRPSSDVEHGGVLSYTSQLAVSPTGREAVLPGLQANTIEGTFRSTVSLHPDTTVRAAVAYLALGSPPGTSDRRKQLDDRGYASAAAFSPRGDYLYLTLPGNRAVARLDMLSGAPSGSLANVGLAPDGLLVSEDGRWVVTNVVLSRRLVSYANEAFRAPAPPVAQLALVEREPLPAQQLRGKQLFNDAYDTRLASSGYLACAHCHLDGEDDHRVWDFSQRGEGLRNTLSLLGKAGLGDGPLHWSANFDEVQDFENDIRGAFGGSGLLSDAHFLAGTRRTSLGDAKVGLSEDLDALAAYVTSLAQEPKSPHRAADGSLTAVARQGKALFESPALECSRCHTGPRLTDSGWLSPGVPRLHDVGTATVGSGNRLGGPLPGFDTPTLHGLWASAPYLHDGSATTLREVLTRRNPNDRHGKTSALTASELDSLVEYLLSLDGQTD